MTEPPLELDLLGTAFRIEIPDARWSSFLHKHWGTFATSRPTEPLPVRLEERDGKTWLQLPGQPALPFENAWTLAEVLRYWIVEHAAERARSMVLFHAAALTREGSGIMCAGPSGAGKTTLAVALASAGWALASDDVAPIEPATGLVHPFPKPLSIRKPEEWPYERSPWEAHWPPVGPGPMLVPADFFAVQSEPFRPSWLTFIEYAPGVDPLVEPITGARAAAISIEYVRSGGPVAVATLARLCRAAVACRIRYRNSDEAVELIESLVSNRQK